MILIPCEDCSCLSSHTPTFFQRVPDYGETVVFGFHVDSEGASSVDVCARVFVFSGDSFLLQQHSSELLFEAMVVLSSL